MEKEISVVDFMSNELLYLDNEFDMMLIDKNEYQVRRKEIINQAKAMEKDQSLKMLPYDLDELADEHANQFMDGKDHFYGFKAGFQKALELLTFKSE